VSSAKEEITRQPFRSPLHIFGIATFSGLVPAVLLVTPVSRHPAHGYSAQASAGDWAGEVP